MGRDTFDITVRGRRAQEVKAEVLDWMRSKRIRVVEDQGYYILCKKGGFWVQPIFLEIRFEEHLRGVRVHAEGWVSLYGIRELDFSTAFLGAGLREIGGKLMWELSVMVRGMSR